MMQQDPGLFNGIKVFITKAVSYKRDIVPFYIYGRNSRFFYIISFVRRVLGIKSNIELIMLPREMFRKKNKTIKDQNRSTHTPSKIWPGHFRIGSGQIKCESMCMAWNIILLIKINFWVTNENKDYCFENGFSEIWYWYINKSDKNAEILFMNYGHADTTPAITSGWQKMNHNRYSIQLYHYLASAIELQNKDIYEVGCGRGGGLDYIARHFSPTHLQWE